MSEHISKKEDFEVAVPEYLLRLDLACGKNKKEGFKSVDKDRDCNPDFLFNLFEMPWIIFKDQSVYEIFCNNFIQKGMRSYLDIFMDECYRILVPHGRMQIIAPYYTYLKAQKYPLPITEETFNDYTDKFLIRNTRYYFNPEWETRSTQAQDWARQHYFNVVQAIEFILEKK